MQEIITSNQYPLLSALLLGALTALNPCQLAINLSALTYLHKSHRGGRLLRGWVYCLGRISTYTLMGWVLAYVLRKGEQIDAVKNVLSYGETVLPPVLIAIGLFFVYRAFHVHHHDANCHNSRTTIRRSGPFGAFFLGMSLAFAFCPESAIFYFGIMLPMAVSSSHLFAVPLVYAIASLLPILIMDYLVRTAINRAQRFQNSFHQFQKGINLVSGILFIVMGILMFFI